MHVPSWISIPAAGGLVAHFFYNRYEPRAMLIHLSALLVFPVLSIFLSGFAGNFTGLYSYLIYLSALSLSTIFYRLSPLHPLSRYPGPILARISKLWMLSVVRSGKRHVVLKQLHDRYGPHVRIGPNELSFCDVDAIQPIMGTDGIAKGPKWDVRAIPNPAIPPVLIALRSPTEHTARRRIWARAFTANAIKEYHPSIIKRANQLVSILSEESSKHGMVDVSKWIGYFTFDFMGDMVFGGGFELMSETKDHEFMHLMHKNLEVAAKVEQIPWAYRLLFKLPSITKDMVNFKYRAIATAKARYDTQTPKRDLFFHLIDESDALPADRKPSVGQITTDASLAISAGADTTSGVLTSCVYALTKNPAVVKRLREEIDALFSDAGDDESVLLDSQALANSKFLNAVINESLRLFPPVASGSERSPYPGTGSKVFGDHVIPEGNSVTVPTYAIQRDPRYFGPLPDTFWPERWILAEENNKEVNSEKLRTDAKIEEPKTKITHNTAAFVPFSYGPANCVGMRLAMLEMRIVVALLVRNFDFAPAQGVGREDLEKYEGTIEDWFAVSVGQLNVKLTPRPGRMILRPMS